MHIRFFICININAIEKITECLMKNLVLSVALCLFGMSVSASRPKESRTRYYRYEVNVSIAKDARKWIAY